MCARVACLLQGKAWKGRYPCGGGYGIGAFFVNFIGFLYIILIMTSLLL